MVYGVHGSAGELAILELKYARLYVCVYVCGGELCGGLAGYEPRQVRAVLLSLAGRHEGRDEGQREGADEVAGAGVGAQAVVRVVREVRGVAADGGAEEVGYGRHGAFLFLLLVGEVFGKKSTLDGMLVL